MKLNLGSGYSGCDALHVVTGTQVHPDWIFVEVCDLPHYREAAKGAGRFDCYDFSDGIREPDNSIEMVWMGDVLEHIYHWKCDSVLRDCFRVLEPGGQLLVSVPDMTRAMSNWLHYDGEHPESLTLICGQQDERDRKNSGPDSHYNIFTESRLTRLLAAAGFVNIERVKVHGTWYELAMSAHKPGQPIGKPPELTQPDPSQTECVEFVTHTLYHWNPTLKFARWRVPGFPIIVGGSVISAADWDHLERDHGITHCINVESEHSDVGKMAPDKLCERQVHDDASPFPVQTVRDICSFVSAARAANPAAKFYVHCQMGGSRSPAFAYAVLRGSFGLSPSPALEAINRGFPHRKAFGDEIYGWHDTHKRYIASVEAALEGWNA